MAMPFTETEKMAGRAGSEGENQDVCHGEAISERPRDAKDEGDS